MRRVIFGLLAVLSFAGVQPAAAGDTWVVCYDASVSVFGKVWNGSCRTDQYKDGAVSASNTQRWSNQQAGVACKSNVGCSSVGLPCSMAVLGASGTTRRKVCRDPAGQHWDVTNPAAKVQYKVLSSSSSTTTSPTDSRTSGTPNLPPGSDQ